MFLIVTEKLIESSEIRILGLAIVLWISFYSINWVTGTLYDNGYDIFGRWNKKRRK